MIGWSALISQCCPLDQNCFSLLGKWGSVRFYLEDTHFCLHDTLGKYGYHGMASKKRHLRWIVEMLGLSSTGSRTEHDRVVLPTALMCRPSLPQAVLQLLHALSDWTEPYFWSKQSHRCPHCRLRFVDTAHELRTSSHHRLRGDRLHELCAVLQSVPRAIRHRLVVLITVSLYVLFFGVHSGLLTWAGIGDEPANHRRPEPRLTPIGENG